MVMLPTCWGGGRLVLLAQRFLMRNDGGMLAAAVSIARALPREELREQMIVGIVK